MNIKEKTYILSDVAGAYTRATLLVLNNNANTNKPKILIHTSKFHQKNAKAPTLTSQKMAMSKLKMSSGHLSST
jgi:hypothetical protein